MILSRCRGCTTALGCTTLRLVATIFFLLAGVICSAAVALAQDDELLNGVLATVQIDGATSPEFVAGSIRYDSPSRAEQIKWRGMLQVQGRQKVTFHAAGSAQLSMKIDGRPVELGTTLGLDAGLRDIEVTASVHPYDSADSEVVRDPIGLYWSSDRFDIEPVPSHLLWHFYDDAPEVSITDGRTLARGLRCAACHEYGESSPLLPAPSLTSLSDNMRPSWLVNHLSRQSADGSSRMPAFGLHRNDAAAITASLFGASQKPAQVPDYRDWIVRQNKNRKQEKRLSMETDAKAGERLFTSVGCLACHHVDQIAAAEDSVVRMYSGGDLSAVAVKRTPAAIKRLLSDPGSINPSHRMPQPDLTPKEQQNLAAFLASLGADLSRRDVRAWGDEDRGSGLLRRNRCGACHELPKSVALPANAQVPRKIALDDASDWTGGCLAGPSRQNNRPGYSLTEEEAAAVQAYILGHRQLPEQTRGERLMEEQNCLSCHDRDSRVGISQHVADILKHFDSGSIDGAALVPPRLHSVGDKLHPSALKQAIGKDALRLRPWLDVRMPRYSLSSGEQDAIVDHLTRADRIPSVFGKSGVEGTPSNDPVHQLAAGRLVTADGFGCQSCHQIGDAPAPNVDLKARGPNLAMLGKRIRPAWFARWVQGPARIVPRMEMPAITKAAPGVLDSSLDKQLDALWSALNNPDFEPPEPNPESVARMRNDSNITEQPIILTDVFECENDQTFLRPVVVGLANRQNVMFDLERAEVAAWWSGDTAFQRTRGKTWYWEPGAQFHGSPNSRASQRLAALESYRLIEPTGQIWSPKPDGQWSAKLETLRSEAGRVTVSAALTFANDLGDSRELGIKQTVSANAFNGFDIETTLSRVPEGFQIAVVNCGPARKGEGDKSEIQVTISSLASQHWSGAIGDDGWLYPETKVVDRSHRFTSSYRGQVADQFLTDSPPASHRSAEKLDVVPGFDALQLPLSIEEMPISMAWDPSGTLYVGSLKGGVFACLDKNDDGLEDTYHPIAPNLPTPYGLAAFEDHIDVLSKFALLRINRLGKPGVDMQVLNADWGYTHDYHDWAVGLEQDGDGNYYIALPCQQDDRSAAAAFRRGTAIKLTPSQSGGRPSYVAEEIAAGLRFPMGIALRDDGELFTSDNQGNYNPFNEINHVRLGKRYGFINKLEKQPGFAPPLEPPAINLPHPWTRSVNGICFLTTPPGMPNDHFGPFEGHLIGCEMNGRSLIRMSLQRVGDTLQGAAYPFSVPNIPADQPNFEGPIVCEVAPSGDIYIGNLHDSGWGGGQNTGSIVRLRTSNKLPIGFAEVTATRTGLKIQFTGPAPRSALHSDNYTIRSYQRISTPIYGGDDVASRTEPIASISQSDNMSVHIDFQKPLRPDCVYEIQSTITDELDRGIFPAEAHYTMRKIPE
ncbi:MAG TPA: hypothetical protein DDW52_05960 [Planctomycetaceae bacterium]|nr:hypothetical protein [Planctomycetaceae bacterium]